MCCLSLLSQANVLQAYDALEKMAVRYYQASDQLIISAPTQGEVSLMMALTPDKLCSET
jgi:hypothetical protein